MPTGRRSYEMSRTVHACGQSRLGHRISVSGQVEDQERHHERTEAVDEDSAEENPRGRGEGAEVFPEAGQRQSMMSRSDRTNRSAIASSNCEPAPSRILRAASS